MDSSTRKHWLTYFALFSASFAINCLYMTYIMSPVDHIYSDMGGYVTRALSWASGGETLAFDLFYPPGTTYFYGLFFLLAGPALGLLLIALAQAALISAANIIAGFSTELLFSRRKAGYTVTALCALYWPFISQTGTFMAEPLLIFLVLAAQLICIHLFKQKDSGKSPKQLFNAFFAGAIFGAAVLVKGQALAFVLGIGITALLCRPLKTLRLLLLPAAIGFLLPIALQYGVNYKKVGDTAPLLSSNGAYNTYLGQSRLRALGCVDEKNGLFYIFHNNNAGLGYDFLPPLIVKQSITNQGYFWSKTRKLWFEDPWRQVIVSLQSVVEVFSINPHWPARNIELNAVADAVFQALTLILLGFPLIYTAYQSIFNKEDSVRTCLLLMPIVLLGVMCFLTMGQPRYVIPFRYNFFLLSIPFYQDAWRREKAKSAFFALLIFLIVLLCGEKVTQLCDKKISIENKSLHTTLAAQSGLPNNQSTAVAKFDLGVNKTLVWQTKGSAVYKVSTTGFNVGTAWHSKPSHRIFTGNLGQIQIKFPRRSVSRVAVQLSDGDSPWRAAVLKSSGKQEIAQRNYHGRWYTIDVTDSEAAQGLKTIEVARLTGDDVSVSSLALFR